MRADGSVDRSAVTDKNGAYRIALPPGTYDVSTEADGMMGGCTDATTSVKAGRFTKLDISCDTGIR